MSFKERCAVSEKCLPDSEYKKCLVRLHKDMLSELEEEREIKSISISALKEIANSYHGVYGVTAKDAAIAMNGRAEEALMKIDEVYSNGN